LPEELKINNNLMIC